MSTPAVSIAEDATLAEAARLMTTHRTGCLPVVSTEGKMTGVLTERSFLPSERHLPLTNEPVAWLGGQQIGDFESFESALIRLQNMPVKPAVTGCRRRVLEETTLHEVAHTLFHEGINHVVVVRDDVPADVISRHDLVRVFAEVSETELR